MTILVQSITLQLSKQFKAIYILLYSNRRTCSIAAKLLSTDNISLTSVAAEEAPRRRKEVSTLDLRWTSP